MSRSVVNRGGGGSAILEYFSDYQRSHFNQFGDDSINSRDIEDSDIFSDINSIHTRSIHEMANPDFQLYEEKINFGRNVPPKPQNLFKNIDTRIPDMSELLIGLEMDEVKSIDFQWVQESNIFLATSILASIKCQLGVNSEKIEKYMLIVYLNKYDKFYLVDPNKYDQGVFHRYDDDVVIVEAGGKITVFHDRNIGNFERVLTRDLSDVNNKSGSQKIILNDMCITHVIMESNHGGLKNHFFINTMVYDVDKRDFVDNSHFRIEINCKCEWPVNVISDDNIPKFGLNRNKRVGSVELHAFEAMRQYLRNGNYFSQSNYQFIELLGSENGTNNTSLMAHGCLFWIFDALNMRNTAFYTNIGHLAQFSYDGRLLLLLDEKNAKLCFWYVENLFTQKVSKVSNHQFSTTNYSKLPEPFKLDIVSNLPIFFEIVTDETPVVASEDGSEIDTSHIVGNLRMLIIYDNMALEMVSMDFEKTKLTHLYRIEMPMITRLMNISFDGTMLTLVDRSKYNQSFIYMFNAEKNIFEHLLRVEQPYVTKKSVLYSNHNGFLVTCTQQGLTRIHYSCISKKMCAISHTSQHGLNFVRLSPSGHYIIFTICSTDMMNDWVDYGFLDLENRTWTIKQSEERIIDATFSLNDKLIAYMTRLGNIIIHETKNRLFEKIVLNLAEFEKSHVAIDMTQCFGERLEVCDNGKNRIRISENEILTMVGKDRRTGIIYVVWYDLNTKEVKKHEIAKIIDSELEIQETVINLSQEIEEEQENSKNGEYDWLFCNWYFSDISDHLIFYFSNLEVSKTIVWNCELFKITHENLFQFTLLTQYITKEKSFYEINSEGQHSFVKKEKEKYAVDVEVSIGGVLQYAVFRCVFSENADFIILGNPEENSLFVATVNTTQEEIEKIISQKLDFDLQKIKIGSNNKVYFIDEDDRQGGNPIVRQVDIRTISKNAHIGQFSKINMSLPMSLRHANLKKLKSENTNEEYEIIEKNMKEVGMGGNDIDFDEKLLICKDSTIMVYSVNNITLHGEYTSSKAIIWDPSNAFHSALLDYDILRMIKGDRLEVEDIQHILYPHLINNVDGNGYNLLINAISYENIEIVEHVINWANRKGVEIKLRSDTSIFNNPNINSISAVELCLHTSNKELMNTLKNGLMSNIAGYKETIELLTECKEKLMKKFPQIFVELVRGSLRHKGNRRLSKEAFKDKKYIGITDDDADCPPWLLTIIKSHDSSIRRDFQLLKEVFRHVDELLRLEDDEYLWKQEIRNLFIQKSIRGEKYHEAYRNIIGALKADTIQVFSAVHPWKNSGKIGDDGIIGTVLKGNLQWQVFDAWPIRALIDYKWKLYGRKLLVYSAIEHMLLLFFFIMYLILIGAQKLDITEIQIPSNYTITDYVNSNSDLYLTDYSLNTDASDYEEPTLVAPEEGTVIYQIKYLVYRQNLKFACLGVCFFISILNLVLEYVEFSRIWKDSRVGSNNPFKNVFKAIGTWFYSKWNVFEFLTYISIIVILPILQYHHYKSYEENIGKIENTIGANIFISGSREKGLIHENGTLFSQNLEPFGNNLFEISPYANSLNNCIAIVACLIFWKLLYFSLPFKQTGPLVIAIFEIISDIKFFIILLGLILLGFGTTFYLLFRNEDAANDILQGAFETYGKSISSTFGIMLGDFNFNRFYDSKVPGLGTLLAILFLVIVMIIMLNLLIAIMGDSYNRIKTNEEISFYIARAQIICDVESKLFDRSIKIINSKLIKEYFHILYMQKIEDNNTEANRVNLDQIVDKLVPSLEKYLIKNDKSSTPKRSSRRYHRPSELWASKDDNLLLEATESKKFDEKFKQFKDEVDNTLNSIEKQLQSFIEEISSHFKSSSSSTPSS